VPTGGEVELQRGESRRFREVHDWPAPFERVARLVIVRRAEPELSQHRVAERMGTTASSIARGRPRSAASRHRGRA
jgi:hypothetical protein